MPFIHVKSLPLDPGIEVAALVEGLSEDFAKEMDIDIRHVTTTWEFFEPGSYAVAGKAPLQQPRSTHPVLVDMLSPDFNSLDTIQTMLRVVASSIARRMDISVENIFINHRQARSGMVFDAGEVVEW